MARRLTALKPLTLSSEKTAHDGLSCSLALTMPTAISAPPTTLTPSVISSFAHAEFNASKVGACNPSKCNSFPVTTASHLHHAFLGRSFRSTGVEDEHSLRVDVRMRHLACRRVHPSHRRSKVFSRSEVAS